MIPEITIEEIRKYLEEHPYDPDNVVHGYDGIFPTTYFKDSGILIYDYPDQIHFRNNKSNEKSSDL